MGMTIDMAIAIIENPTDYFPKDIEEVKHFMIDTMRKYQKIEEIVEHWACCGNPSDSMIAISEVIEDENVDN